MATATQPTVPSAAQAADPSAPTDPAASSTLVASPDDKRTATNTEEGADQAATSSSEAPPAGTRKSKKSNPSPPSTLTKATPAAPRSQQSPAQNKKPKRSIWSSFRNLLLPCIPSADGSKAHDIDVGSGPGKTTGPAAKDAEKQTNDGLAPTHEKGASVPSSSTAAQTGTTSTTEPPSTPTKTKPTPLLTLPHTTDSPVEQDGDVTVVIPPSPHSHLLPREETEGVTSGAVQPPGSTGGESSQLLHPPTPHHPHHHHPSTGSSAGTATITSDSDVSITDENEGDVADNEGGTGHGAGEMDAEDEDDEEERLIMQGGTGIPIGPDGQPCPLLPPMAAHHKGRKCLVLDLDETLLHSSFKLIPQADYVVPVEIEWQWHNVYVIKRPGVDNFLKKMGELYEVVIFTASLSKYADPVLDKLDIHKVVAHRLFRESCYNHKGNYVKDLSRLGRPVEDMIILDNSPASYIFHPNNAVPVSSWFNDPHDTELTDLCPFLADLMSVEDVRGVLDGGL